MHPFRAVLLILGILLNMGCTEEAGTSIPDAETASWADAEADAVDDSFSEAAPDTVTVSDAAPDVVTVSDTAPDTVADTVTDTVPDAVTDSGSVPDTASDADAAADTAPSWDVTGPPSVFVTVNRIPAEMNGSEPYLGREHPESAFRLRLPPNGFTVDVEVKATSGGPPIDLSSLVLTAEFLPAAGGEAQSFDWSADVSWEESWASVQILDEDGLAPGELSLHATATDVLGQFWGESELIVDVGELRAEIDPFVTPDTWLVTFSRDFYSLELVDNGDGSYGLTPGSEPWESDGVPDFDEAFAALGLMSSNAETNAHVRSDLIEAIRSEARRIYRLEGDGSIGPDSVRIDLIFEGDPGADELEGEPGIDFSAIAVGGDGSDETIARGSVGRARADANNQGVEDDSVKGLGVFTGQVARVALRTPAVIMLVQDIFPLTGTPIGEYEGDATWWEPDFDPADITDGRLRNRYNLYQFALQMLSRALGSILCHEMGHSLGLVPADPPPAGLFGGMDLPWAASNPGPWHIDPPGLNVMQTGASTNYLEAAAFEPEYTALNLAYLRRRVIVDPSASSSKASAASRDVDFSVESALPVGPAPGRAIPCRLLLSR